MSFEVDERDEVRCPLCGRTGLGVDSVEFIGETTEYCAPNNCKYTYYIHP